MTAALWTLLAVGGATYYGPEVHNGRLTASGDVYCQYTRTVAVGRKNRHLLGRPLVIVSDYGEALVLVNDICGECDEYGVIVDCTPYVHRLLSPDGGPVKVRVYTEGAWEQGERRIP